MKARNRQHHKGFTEKQREILPYVLKGMSHKEIANELDINTKALKWRLTYVYIKTGTSGIIELLGKAIDLGVNPRYPRSIDRLLLPKYQVEVKGEYQLPGVNPVN